MGRKTIGILTILLLFGLVAGWYYFTRESKYFNTPAIRAIPQNTALIVRVQDISVFSDRSSKNFLLREFSSFSGLSFLTDRLHIIDSTILHNPTSKKYLADKNITLAYGGAEGKKSLLYLVELSDMAEKTAIKNLIRDYFIQRNASSITRKEEEITATVYYWSSGPSRITFCACFYKGIFIGGSDPDRVIEAARQLDQPIPDHRDELQQIARTASPNADLNVYINRRLIGSSLDVFFSRSFITRIKVHAKNLSWSEIDCNLRENEILFNGFTFPGDSIRDYQSILLRQKPIPFQLERYFPAETSFYLALNMENCSSFLNDYEKMLSENGELETYKKNLLQVDTLYGINLQNLIRDHISGSVAMVFTQFDSSDPRQNRYLILKIKNIKNLDSLLQRMVKPIIPGKIIPFRGLSQEFKMGKDTIFKMYQIPVQNLGQRVFGNIFQGIPTAYFTICDSCLILGGSFKELENYLQSVNLRETLDKTPLYKEYSEKIAQPSSLCFWGIPSQFLPFFSNELNPGLYREIEDQATKIQKINSLGWQLGRDRNRIYHTGRISCSPAFQNTALRIWRVKIDSTLLTKPYFVSNPESNKPDILVQDKLNKLYLVRNNGKLIWQRDLSGPLLSQIYAINYYKDRRVQFLFNTADAIHLLDSEGKEIPGFPVKLKFKATNGIGVFDYDQTKDYRIFIAGDDRNIYAFDRNGILITGWQSAPAEDLVLNPVQFFRVMGRDYIVYTDRKKVHILDRKGNPRVLLQEEITPSLHNGFTLEPATVLHPPRIVTTNQEGKITMINFDGSVRYVPTKKFSDQHYFIDADLDRDGQHEYIILDGNTLFAYNIEGGEIFNRKFSANIDFAPEMIDMQDKGYKIGVLDRSGNQIFLLDQDGSDYRGFPIEGNSPFSIGVLNPGFNQFNLLTGSRDEYLNNYSIR